MPSEPAVFCPAQTLLEHEPSLLQTLPSAVIVKGETITQQVDFPPAHRFVSNILSAHSCCHPGSCRQSLAHIVLS